MSSFIAVFLFFTTPAVTGLFEVLVGKTGVYLLIEAGLDWGALILGTEPCWWVGGDICSIGLFPLLF